MGTALITGASSGLGVEFAWQLATARHNLVLVSRDAERLERLAAKIRAAAGVRVEVLPADLAERSDLDRVAARLRAGTGRVGLLVNNAGYGLPGAFLENDLASEERMLDVMVRAVLVLSHEAADAMTARRRGAILNVSSIAAHLTSGTYSAAKAWVKTFTEGLAIELRDTGVTATALLPGLVRTEFHDRAGLDYSAIPDVAWLNVDQVVSHALADVRAGAVLSTPSLRYALVGQAARLAPRWLIRALAQIQ